MSSQLVTTLRHIRELASRAIAGDTDALVAARKIDAQATQIGLGLEKPFIVLKGIVSQADEVVELEVNRPGFIGEPIMREDGSDAPTQQVFPRVA